MTTSQKLTTVLNYAVKKGYRWTKPKPVRYVESERAWQYKSGSYFVSLESVIFSHDFCKAVYGEDLVCKNDGYHMRRRSGDIIDRCIYCEQPIGYLNWQYHLQQQVLSPDPIDYLYQYIKNKE